jgi:hypothetical protein
MSNTISDFTTYQIGGKWHWEGTGKYANYCSEDGFSTEAQAGNDAIALLQSVDDQDSTPPDLHDLLNDSFA